MVCEAMKKCMTRATDGLHICDAFIAVTRVCQMVRDLESVAAAFTFAFRTESQLTPQLFEMSGGSICGGVLAIR